MEDVIPNLFAYFILIITPIIIIKIYKKKSVQEATFWAIVGAHLFMPSRVSFDLIFVPDISKATVPVLMAWYACNKIAKVPIGFFNAGKKVTILFLIYILSPLATALLNTDPIYFPWGKVIEGDSFYNYASVELTSFILIVPFFIGFHVFKTTEDHLALFKLLIISGLVYSVLILFEVRISPQLNVWVYGFFPHSFAQQMRGDGFRAVVFVGHGLLVSIFLMTCVTAAAVFWKLKIKAWRYSPGLVWLYFMVVMVFQKSMASLIYAIISSMLIKFGSVKFGLWVARLLVMFSIGYPFICLVNLFPHEAIVNMFGGTASERAASLAFRFGNEHLLLEHYKDRLFFGWGGFGRFRIYIENMSNEYGVTDGAWTIDLGMYGVIGFVAKYGLLGFSAFKAFSILKLIKSDVDKELIKAHAILMSVFMVDQLPNASIDNWVWLLSGALLGRCQYLSSSQAK